MNYKYTYIILALVFLSTSIFSQSKAKYKIDTVNFNSDYNDFGANFFNGDTLYFSDKDEQVALRQFGGKRKVHLSDIQVLNNNNNKLICLAKTINTKFNEGSVSVSPDGRLVFFTRNAFYDSKQRKQKNGKLYLQIFYVELLEDGTWSEEKDLPFNSIDYSVGHPSISKDVATLYFASDMPGGKGGTDIYKVRFDNIVYKVQIESLNNLVELIPDNFKSHSNVSYYQEDNKYNYTIGLNSDYNSIETLSKKLSKDFEDCFVVAFKNGKKTNLEAAIKNKRWGKPINLGENINSSANESFPFITKDNTLYFSSTDNIGYGGLDIYVSEEVDGEFKAKTNLGEPINTKDDDFSFVVSDGNSMNQTGFLSSTRGEENAVKSNIYTWESLFKPLNILGTVKTPDDKLAQNIKLQITDANNNLTTIQTDINGKYSFPVKKGSFYNITIEDELYFKYSSDVSTSVEEAVETIKHEIQLETYPTLVVKPVDEKGDPIVGMRVIIKDTKSNKEFIGVTNEKGLRYEFSKEYDLGDEVKFDISFRKRGYTFKDITFTAVIEHGGDLIVPIEQLIFVKKVVGVELTEVINLNPIYYDYGKFNISDNAAIELDKVVKFLNENPDVTIELSSHSDSRGSNKTNLKLSDKRAKSAADYIKTRINDSKQIFGKGYGETQLLNKCKNGVKCTDEEHAVNRRTEFRIVKFDDDE